MVFYDGLFCTDQQYVIRNRRDLERIRANNQTDMDFVGRTVGGMAPCDVSAGLCKDVDCIFLLRRLGGSSVIAFFAVENSRTIREDRSNVLCDEA